MYLHAYLHQTPRNTKHAKLNCGCCEKSADICVRFRNCPYNGDIDLANNINFAVGVV